MVVEKRYPSRTVIRFLQESEVELIRHNLEESCKYLTFQTNLSNSVRSDIPCRFRRFLQDSCSSRLFLQEILQENILEFTESINFVVSSNLDQTTFLTTIFTSKIF